MQRVVSRSVPAPTVGNPAGATPLTFRHSPNLNDALGVQLVAADGQSGTTGSYTVSSGTSKAATVSIAFPNIPVAQSANANSLLSIGNTSVSPTIGLQGTFKLAGGQVAFFKTLISAITPSTLSPIMCIMGFQANPRAMDTSGLPYKSTILAAGPTYQGFYVDVSVLIGNTSGSSWTGTLLVAAQGELFVSATVTN